MIESWVHLECVRTSIFSCGCHRSTRENFMPDLNRPTQTALKLFVHILGRAFLGELTNITLFYDSLTVHKQVRNRGDGKFVFLARDEGVNLIM